MCWKPWYVDRQLKLWNMSLTNYSKCLEPLSALIWNIWKALTNTRLMRLFLQVDFRISLLKETVWKTFWFLWSKTNIKQRGIQELSPLRSIFFPALMENFPWDFSLSMHTVFYGLQDLPQYFIKVSSLIWIKKKKFISLSNFTVQVLEVGFCLQVLFSAPKKCSLQVPMFYIGVLLFVMCYKITHYQNYAPWRQCAFNMGKVYRTKKVFSSQLLELIPSSSPEMLRVHIIFCHN